MKNKREEMEKRKDLNLFLDYFIMDFCTPELKVTKNKREEKKFVLGHNFFCKKNRGYCVVFNCKYNSFRDDFKRKHQMKSN